MKIGYNGSVIEAGNAVISVYDHGFLYGIGLFETFRTYEGGQPFLLERHLARMMEGCRELGIHCPQLADQAAIRQWLAMLMEANELAEAYVRLTVTAGIGELGLPPADYEQPNMVMMVKKLPAVNEQLYANGKELRRLAAVRNSPEGAVRRKSLHYMNNIIAKRELVASGAAPGSEGLMLTREGWLAEGIVSNLFFVREGRLYTPSIDTGILPGITRERVMELAREIGYSVEEGHYTWQELLQADELWLTNSIQELVPVTRLSEESGAVHVVGHGTAGEVTLRLLHAYRKETSRRQQ
ncbi:4-amino-4-deoxychorismate lyase [Paenibacillaceae bacterium]|nr:4-amino-4-deoxychorismate lyase [Paenibacillaceae bacterium]